jgi:NADPH2:quinone reductase
VKAITIDKFGGAEELHETEIKTPQPQQDEVQIHIQYTGVNPVDWKICEGLLKNWLTHEFPITPGWDASGIISAIGADVTDFEVGDRVYAYCRKPVVREGTYAEFICLDAANVSLKPKCLTPAQAAAIPLVGLTAWQALFDKIHTKKGSTILIHAGAGGVGSMAIQFAKHAGATVFTTASTKNHPYLKDLGADYIIDYNRQDFAAKVKEIVPEGVDFVFDCVGGETQTKSFECMKKGGAMVYIVNKPEEGIAEKYGVTTHYLFVEPNGDQLHEIGDLLDEGIVKCPHVIEMSIKDAAKAFALQKTTHTAGKIVLKLDF